MCCHDGDEMESLSWVGLGCCEAEVLVHIASSEATPSLVASNSRRILLIRNSMYTFKVNGYLKDTFNNMCSYHSRSPKGVRSSLFANQIYRRGTSCARCCM